MWQVFYTRKAQKDMHSLEKGVSKRGYEKLELANENVGRSFEKVEGTGYHKIRVGDYRAIVVLDYLKEIVDVRRVGHRKNIYKKV